MSLHDRLLRLAAVALRVLEEHEEWSADTADKIGMAALDLGLATTDAARLFRADPAALQAAEPDDDETPTTSPA